MCVCVCVNLPHRLRNRGKGGMSQVVTLKSEVCSQRVAHAHKPFPQHAPSQTDQPSVPHAREKMAPSAQRPAPRARAFKTAPSVLSDHSRYVIKVIAVMARLGLTGTVPLGE